MHIAALTQGINVPSARFRIRQLIAPLGLSGVKVTEFPSIPGAYPPIGTFHRLKWAPNVVLDAWHRSRITSNFDVTIIQRELISTLPSFEGILKHPVISDIDDSIWLYRKEFAARHLAKYSDYIVVGNQNLANYFSQFGKDITIIPTGVDIERFSPLKSLSKRSYGVIGWSGTSGGYAYFEMLQNSLAQFLLRHSDWKIRFISDCPPNLPLLPKNQIEYYPWSPLNEASLTADMDIGLMPLDNNSWSYGKCSYKMLLYMACGVPVIASAIGMNLDILRMDDVGFGVNTHDDWLFALDALVDNAELRRDMGSRGRQLVEQQFSLKIVTAQWLDVLANFK